MDCQCNKGSNNDLSVITTHPFPLDHIHCYNDSFSSLTCLKICSSFSLTSGSASTWWSCNNHKKLTIRPLYLILACILVYFQKLFFMVVLKKCVCVCVCACVCVGMTHYTQGQRGGTSLLLLRWMCVHILLIGTLYNGVWGGEGGGNPHIDHMHAVTTGQCHATSHTLSPSHVWGWSGSSEIKWPI